MENTNPCDTCGDYGLCDECEIKGVRTMDMKEKLVELLDQAENQYLEAVSGAESDSERYRIVKDAYGFYADHLVDHGVTVQEWISVKDRLPTEEEDRDHSIIGVVNGEADGVSFLMPNFL